VAESEIVRKLMTEKIWAEVLSWRNDPLVYVWNRTNRPITLFEHFAWFNIRQTTFDSEPVFSYHLRKTIVGSSRLDYLSNETYEVSIIINPKYRGKGFGKFILADTCAYFVSNKPLQSKLIATIHSQNEISQRLFRSLGFESSSLEGNFWTYTYLRTSE
jgi:RimJ/RimL family protein N-acetyltransferase